MVPANELGCARCGARIWAVGMTDRKSNYIAGEWVSGTSEIENRNPSDVSDLIGLFSQAGAHQLETALDAARAAQAHVGGRAGDHRAGALGVVFAPQSLARCDFAQVGSARTGKNKF